MLNKILRDQLVVGVVALGSGAAIGYLIGRNQITKTVRRELDARLENIITVYEETTTIIEENTAVLEGIVVDPNQIPLFTGEEGGNHVVNYHEISHLKLLSGDRRDHPSIGGTEVVAPDLVIIADEFPGWDYDAEKAAREPGGTYIIHRDEYYGDEMGWDEQHSLTWYEGDNILCTEDDSVVYNPQMMVGTLRFGHGSGDPNICFVRNEKMNAEYEVFRNPGAYETEVLGELVEREMEAKDLKHSRAPGKFVRE